MYLCVRAREGLVHHSQFAWVFSDSLEHFSWSGSWWWIVNIWIVLLSNSVKKSSFPLVSAFLIFTAAFPRVIIKGRFKKAITELRFLSLKS